MNHTLIAKRPQWAIRHEKLILLHDNALLPGKYYPTHCIHQTFRRQIYTYCGRWLIHCLSSTSNRTTMSPDVSPIGLPPRKQSSIGTVSTPYLTGVENV
ncbi:hypothetical protein AVEN_211964-1 [Araneus ventricosus]|uniref:Uncharacterized protein n=1 Tax=Araneus ventricosus TaxID=182803 RepID=A0A4Y2FZF4_ARAVE|nr:hypothetical protein AVEN_211964-1 [Araneus ventricosus]